jgi:hypothetical protein
VSLAGLSVVAAMSASFVLGVGAVTDPARLACPSHQW